MAPNIAAVVIKSRASYGGAAEYPINLQGMAIGDGWVDPLEQASLTTLSRPPLPRICSRTLMDCMQSVSDVSMR